MKDFSNRNLRKTSFVNQDLSNANFSYSDLRGADFTGANLNGADFTGVKTGLVPANVTIIFVVSFLISLLSGYIAMLDGRAVLALLLSKEEHERMAGSLSILIIILFIYYAWHKGGGIAFTTIIIPLVIFFLIFALIIYLTGLSTGKGMFYMGLTLILLVVLFITGTVSQIAAGSLSNFLFWVVVISGGLFSKSVGGGIAALTLAIICVLISKKALTSPSGFYFLKNVAMYITSKYGTSFRNTKMIHTKFSKSKLRNVDFSNTNTLVIHWGNVKRINCILGEQIVTDKY